MSTEDFSGQTGVLLYRLLIPPGASLHCLSACVASGTKTAGNYRRAWPPIGGCIFGTIRVAPAIGAINVRNQ
jgi:hypothetical protein